MTNSYENQIIKIEIEDGILYGTYLSEKLDLEGAIKATEFRREVSKGRVLPALVDVSQFKSVSREARTYFAKEAGEDLKALAVLVKNPVTRMMVNFFMKFNNPQYPIRFFTSEHEAYSWLLQFVELKPERNARDTVRHDLL